MAATPIVWTIGHSTRTVEALAALARAHGVTTIADVRTVPRSRHNPQWNREGLANALGAHGLRYVHLPGLGGLRHPRGDSANTGLRNEGFRGYADYMQSPEFESSLAALAEMAGRERVAVMCAEAVPWRCHRSLIADALTARGIPVEHITSTTSSHGHALHAAARVDGTRVTYPPEAPPLPGLLGDDRTDASPRRRASSSSRRATRRPNEAPDGETRSRTE
jgi:uncharacterized protein (DUF488 family)